MASALLIRYSWTVRKHSLLTFIILCLAAFLQLTPVLPPSHPAPPTSSTPTPSPHTSLAIPAPLTLSPPLPFTKGTIIASSASPVPFTTNLTRHTLITRTQAKYPLLRVEEVQRLVSTSSPPAIISRQLMVADHVLIRSRPNISIASLQAFCSQHNLNIRKALNAPDRYLISTTTPVTPQTIPDLVATLSSSTNYILYAEPDYILHATQTFPNDTSFSSLWGLHNTGQSEGSPDADINAPEAWDITTDSSNVIIGVIDSGIITNHPDLAANIWINPLETLNGLDDDGNGYTDDIHGWDFAFNDNNPSDANSHGTHVAGTIAAVGNNNLGVVGVSWNSRLMPLRFLDETGSGYSSDAIAAIYYATDMRRRGINIRLTNNSWGGDGDQSLQDAIQESADAGLLFIAAAGNDTINNDSTPFIPASYPLSNIIAVAAITRNNTLSYFSNYGATTVDLGAPGSDIYSTMPSGYGFKGGTSMAAPHVAGVAALLWSEWPEASCTDIRNAILGGTVPTPALNGKTVTGGLLNAYNALVNIFHIIHTPAQSNIDNGNPYPITISLCPARLVDTNNLSLFWNTDGSTNYTSTPLTTISTNRYQGNIPPQPAGSIIRYWIKAGSTANTTVTLPVDAPGSVHQFTIMPTIELTVTGSPASNGPASPPYGTHAFPSGIIIEATAAAHTPPTNDTRWACLGWSGSGSVPTSGQSNVIALTLLETSSIDWLWSLQYALSQSSSIPGLLSTTTWWTATSTATTLTASPTTSLNGTNYAFAYWLLDDLRQPNPNDPALNPITLDPILATHHATAVYIPETLDADNDALPDWWELHYFGSTNSTPDADDDSDSFSTLTEYLDRSSPRDPSSIPTPPLIQHTPIPSPQAQPAPFPLSAIVTDNFQVTTATLHWSLSGAPVQSTPMLPSPTHSLYHAELHAPATNGNTFTYWITAADPLGQPATNGPHTVHILYPLIHLAPASLHSLVHPNSTTNLPLRLTNLGSATMQASISLIPPGYSNNFDNIVTGWVSSGAGNLWTLSTNRAYSPPNAWYCGNPALRLYTDNMHACLDTPPLYLGSNSLMSFSHWIASELDTSSWRPDWRPMHTWDGAIVEISTNAGNSFQQITPLGGYPYAITGWSNSPWSDDTPCFAGSGEWQQSTFDLSPFATRLVTIRFHFGTDSNTRREGWFIDDLLITPSPAVEPWLTFTPTNLLISPAATATVTVSYSSDSIPTGDREAALLLTCNDPITPLTIIPNHMLVRSHPILTWLSASQTSTNGEGWATLANTVYDADGDPCALELNWTTNNNIWTGAWVRAATATIGNPSFHYALPPQVDQIPTTSNTTPSTNTLIISWDTSPSGNNLSCSTSTLVRARLWDGLLWSDWTTSQPFLVDNVPPPTPTSLSSPSHTIYFWSANPAISLSWDPVTDSRLAGYSFSFWTNDPAESFTGFTVTTSTESPPLPDHPRWKASVRSRDTFGNLSPFATLSSFKLDTTPPSPTGATITLSLEPDSHCLIATNSVSASWSGFSDPASGISRYFFSLTNASPSTNGIRTISTVGTLTGLTPDATNTFNVWAMDRVGLIGSAATASFLVLSANGDWDGDGMPNLSESIAGTDPAQSSSLLQLNLHSPFNPGLIIITWPSVTNRLYTLAHSDNLLPPNTNWASMTNWIKVPGVDGAMSCTDQAQNIPARFYRITAEKP